ncbi:putative Xaa-Pro aminopeptidase 3 [Orchesella cincta]|uniref:Putative Xaa-Pro aminopeptidase 3 n=1 Tax=Orchesella cincta TaxID=48709 RepID=A0A1D2NF88_ORCCI|nr:putative Xaa-Pro aminopeptidase 3 [Orchesella cincta]
MSSTSPRLLRYGRQLIKHRNIASVMPCGSFILPNNACSVTSWNTQQVRMRNMLSLGQPTLESHSEFFSDPEQVMPGIYKEELRSRRQSLCHIVSELVAKRGSEVNHLIVIPASSKKFMSENIPYPYRQNSNFLYLSGSYDHEAFLVLCVTGKEQLHTLFLSDPDPTSDLWDGPKTSPQAAVDHYGFDQAYLASEFESFMTSFAQKTKRKVKVWCEDRSIVERYLDPSFGFEFKNAESPKAIIDTLRLIKSPAEIDLMRHSSRIASEAFQQTIRFCAEWNAKGQTINEHQIWAKLDYECRMHGAERLAYPPVVASGGRANIIHYVFNSNKCQPNDMILVDAGCEFFGYCSDITRTWPVGGKFTNEHHKSLYEMMHKTQTELIKKVEPGISLDQLFGVMSEYLVKGLEELGIIKEGSSQSGNCQEIALRFCPHHVSHYLGMDVHDTATVGRNEPLAAGMVITVEPGIYLRTSSNQRDYLTKVGKEFNGIAIRIEDDVLVTENGHNVLTSSCPKSVKDIENWGTVPQT